MVPEFENRCSHSRFQQTMMMMMMTGRLAGGYCYSCSKEWEKCWYFSWFTFRALFRTLLTISVSQLLVQLQQKGTYGRRMRTEERISSVGNFPAKRSRLRIFWKLRLTWIGRKVIFRLLWFRWNYSEVETIRWVEMPKGLQQTLKVNRQFINKDRSEPYKFADVYERWRPEVYYTAKRNGSSLIIG